MSLSSAFEILEKVREQLGVVKAIKARGELTPEIRAMVSESFNSVARSALGRTANEQLNEKGTYVLLSVLEAFSGLDDEGAIPALLDVADQIQISDVAKSFTIGPDVSLLREAISDPQLLSYYSTISMNEDELTEFEIRDLAARHIAAMSRAFDVVEPVLRFAKIKKLTTAGDCRVFQDTSLITIQNDAESRDCYKADEYDYRRFIDTLNHEFSHHYIAMRCAEIVSQSYADKSSPSAEDKLALTNLQLAALVWAQSSHQENSEHGFSLYYGMLHEKYARWFAGFFDDLLFELLPSMQFLGVDFGDVSEEDVRSLVHEEYEVGKIIYYMRSLNNDGNNALDMAHPER